MFLKGLFKNSNSFIQLSILIIVVFLGYLFGQFLSVICILLQTGISAEEITNLVNILDSSPNLYREIMFINHLFSFFFPAIFVAYLFSDSYKNYLRLDIPFDGGTVLWTILSMIFIIPLINYTTYLNEQMSLPAALKDLEALMQSMEEEAKRLTELILNTDNFAIFLLNILIIAVLAAVGEEFIFRGTLQNIFGKTIRNKHIVIWSVAIIFSAIHLQFYGFIPRMLLGAYFGYLLLYTKTLWIPILAHFTNNLIGVTASWIYRDNPQALESLDTAGFNETWWMSPIFLALFIFAFLQIRKRNLQ
jgi:membrane protease YdiL (CAAX protease family)